MWLGDLILDGGNQTWQGVIRLILVAVAEAVYFLCIVPIFVYVLPK